MKLGKNMKHALAFSIKYKGWHCYDKRSRCTVRAIERLQKLNLVEVNEFYQFRLKEYYV